jgi:uncharacterized protein (DUF488 family)
MKIWTIGHSTRTLPELVAALRAYEIEGLADVRAFPSSARCPQFNRANLSAELPKAGITYRWLGEALGGYRKKRPATAGRRADSPHSALRSEGFRNYADRMETEAFGQGIQELLTLAERNRVAYMCAEKLWWRCHRSLISDYLAALCGAEVVHIRDEKKTEAHHLHRVARVANGRLVYDVSEAAPLDE